jgi:diguanylate cyclase (GGDEF)-like protein/PAS domain S-box-containing protein
VHVASRISPWLNAFTLGCCYFVVAALTVTFTRFDGGVAFIWASSGLLLARLSQLSVRRWVAPLVACGIALFVMSTLFGLGIRVAPMLTLVNLCEPVLAALMLRRTVGRSVQTDTGRAVGWFLFVAGVFAPAVSGLAGAAVVSAATGVPFGANFLGWFAAHGLGALLVTPIASVCMSGEARLWYRQAGQSRTLSTTAMLVVVALVTGFVFSQNRLPILFLPMLPMVFATMHGGRLGAIAGTIILATVAGFLSAHGSGPVHLIKTSTGFRTIFLQAYVAYTALLVLPIAAILKQRETLNTRLTESEARYRSIADSIGDGVLDVGVDGTIRYASPAIVSLTGRTPESLIGASAKSLVQEEDLAGVWQAHMDALAHPGLAFGAQYRDSGNSERWFEVTIRAVCDQSGTALGVVGSIRDISARKAREHSLKLEAQTDVLTGLPNRRAFLARLGALQQADRAGSGGSGGTHALAIFDLDRFKAVNDTWGHAGGDAVLVAVAGAVQSALRTGDMTGRLGGEEFGAILRVDAMADAGIAAERLQNAIRALRIPFEGRTLTITASMGLCEIGRFETTDDLMAAADRALYEAKRAGRNCLRIAA